MAEVKALKSFQGTPEEGYVKAGQKITVTTERQRELARNGLVPPVKGDPEPEPQAAGVLTGAALTPAPPPPPPPPAPKKK